MKKHSPKEIEELQTRITTELKRMRQEEMRGDSVKTRDRDKEQLQAMISNTKRRQFSQHKEVNMIGTLNKWVNKFEGKLGKILVLLVLVVIILTVILLASEPRLLLNFFLRLFFNKGIPI